MVRKGMTGQLNMFDFFSSIDEGANGEVEMVSLMPGFEEKPESVVEEPVEGTPEPIVKEEPELVVEEPVEGIPDPIVKEEPEPVVEKPVMSRTYEIDGENIEIAYLNYNKVRMIKGKHAPEIQSFESSKEAVDYYVKLMHSYESEDE